MDLLSIILIAVGLAMDCFAVSIAQGLDTDVRDVKQQPKVLLMAFLFGLFQGGMPLIGYYAGTLFADFFSRYAPWIALALLAFIGGKMIIEGIQSLRKPSEEKNIRLFSIKEVLLFGIATSIDALGSGVALHSGLSNNTTIFIHIAIIISITFVISFLGVVLGGKIEKLFKGKTEITSIVGGAILVILAIWIILSHYLPL